MKKMILALLAFSSISAFATIDALTQVWIVVDSGQEEGQLTLSQVPVFGCYGLNQGPQLAQLTAPYEVSVSMGCGSFERGKMNINALVCAKVVKSEESDNYNGFKRIFLDITGCPQKDNPRFVTLVRTAVKKNFPQYDKDWKLLKKEVELVLIK